MNNKINYFIFLICLSFCMESIAEKMKLYVIFTPSHEKMFHDWFLKSIQDDYEIVVKKFPQIPGAEIFRSEAWIKTMLYKVEVIIQAILDNWNKVFIYSDVDIQFFKPTEQYIRELIQGYDFIVQRNRPTGECACAGFFACRGNETTLKLWRLVAQKMKDECKSDQPMLNAILNNLYFHQLKWKFLPIEFFSAGTLTGLQWKPGDKLDIPKNIILHHANFTKGVKNKLAQLALVRQMVDANNKGL